MGERKMRISDVMRETGLSRTTVTLLYKETALKVDLEALDKLCDLFDCEIQDLLQKSPAETEFNENK
jgi:putative transcriptional regulator|tara:strand:+ start:1045 stop:1245 length:201 start_codon:yes stop_codon:yes gene_type:complete